MTYDLTLISAYLRSLRPEPTITVSEWANSKRILPAASAQPGKFRTSVTPYVVEIMDKLSAHNPAQKIIVKKGSQIAFTETGNNWLGYVIDVSPAPFLYVMPTDSMMKKTSKTRIQPMIASTPALSKKVLNQKSRDAGNTILEKDFEGGYLVMIGANSPVGLSSTAVRYVYMDEIDRYPLDVGGEGSALDLAETRTATFGARKKIFITSTPTRKGTSAIDIEFETTGQRYYYVPCPFCGGEQVLVIEQLRYEIGRYDQTTYECQHCHEQIAERYKTGMLANGRWLAKYPEKEDGITYGYHLSAMYSPYGWYSWAQMARDREQSANSIPKKIVFVNTKLGECYEDEGEKPDWSAIMERAEDYQANKPFPNVAAITAGVDVQGDRIELMITGWMAGMKSQMLDYRVLVGDTSKPEVWDQLGKVVYEGFRRQDGAILPVRLMAVDTGYETKMVYDFTRKHSLSRVIPVKGRDKLDMMFSPPKAVTTSKSGQKIGGVKVWGIGVSMIKSELYGKLKLTKDYVAETVPDGYCYFRKMEPYFFRGITAEELQMVTSRRGFREYVWVKKFERNEPLDTFVYARAAAAVLGLDRWDDARWKREVFMYEPEPETPVPAVPVKKPVKRKSDFWDR